MKSIIEILIALGVGSMIGTFFFGGLWLTVQKAVTSKAPALWFAASFILRMSITVIGFYYVARESWQQLLVCLAGFLTARFIITKFIGSRGETIFQKGGAS